MQKPSLLGKADFSVKGYTSPEEWSCCIREDQLRESPLIPNYYEATLTPWTDLPSLEGEAKADIVVVGGGLLGVSAALHFAQAGIETVLVEKNHIGSGASGRNGGQLTPGLARWEAEDMIDQFSEDEARHLWRLTSFEAMDLIDQLIEQYDLKANRQYGHITAAVHPGHIQALEKGRQARKFLGDDTAQILNQAELYTHIKSPLYFGGMYDGHGGHIHSLLLTRGLAYAFAGLGGCIYENSPVIAIEKTNGGFTVKTDKGQVYACKAVVLGVHHATHDLLGDSFSTTMPLYSYVGLTTPKTGVARELMPTSKAVYDTSFQIDYFRPVNENSFLFGGEGTGSQFSAEHMKLYLEKRINMVFPDIKDWQFNHLWSGKTDLTYNGAVDCRKQEEGNSVLYAVHGWSGHGIAQTVRIGKAIRDDFLGKTDDFSMLSSIRHVPIPFASRLSPFVISLAKSWAKVNAFVSPGKMISF